MNFLSHLLASSTTLADQFINDTIVVMSHSAGPLTTATVRTLVRIQTGSDLYFADVLVDIERLKDPRVFFRDLQQGCVIWQQHDGGDALTGVGNVNGVNCAQITVVPAGKGLRVTFHRIA